MAKTKEEIVLTAIRAWKEKDKSNEFWFKAIVEGAYNSGYTGSIHAVLYNHGQEAVAFNAGDKVCQLVVLPCVIDPVEVVDDLEETERGDAGFGSTGR